MSGEFLMGMEAVQRQKPELEVRTPVLDNLKGYDKFKHSFKDYLREPGNIKRLVIGGRSGEGKTRFALEVLASILNDPDVIAYQASDSFEYEIDYVNIGQGLDAARRARLIRTPKGSHTVREYRRSSLDIASIMALSEQVPRLKGKKPFRKRLLQIYDYVLITGVFEEGEIKGTDRGLPWARHAISEGGFCVLMNAPEIGLLQSTQDQNQDLSRLSNPEGRWILEKLFMRKAILAAKPEEVKGILEAKGIIDDRTPEEIQLFYAQSGNIEARMQQDSDVYFQVCRLASKRAINKPDFNLTPAELARRPDQTGDIIRNGYLSYWLRSIFQGDYEDRGYIFRNNELPQGTKLDAFGEQLKEASLLPKLDVLTRDIRSPEIFVLRRALRILGAIPRLKKAA